MKNLYFILISLFLISCDGDINPRDLLPEANGAHGEILILMDDALWNGPVGETLVSQLTQHCKGPYLRPEPLFSYSWTTPDHLNHTNQLNRNLLKLMVDYDSSYAATKVIEKRDYYAKGQLFLVIKDSDIDRLYEFVINDFNQIADRFNDFELHSYMEMYEDEPNKGVNELAEKKFGLHISIPKDSEVYDDRDGFLWVKRDRSKNLIGSEAKGTRTETYWIQQGILFWSEPYTGEEQLTIENVLQKRDTVLKYNVAGKIEGSYMATEYDPYYKPEGRKFSFKGSEAVEIRGLWKHAGHPAAFGGGPFVQYTIHNKAKNLVVTVCGFIYGPQFDKREYIREIDAMLNTIEVLN